MKSHAHRALAIAALAFTWPAAAQPVAPRYDEPAELRDRGDEYRRGFEAGFERGYAKGLSDGERRAAPVMAPPPAPPLPMAPRLGPIRITGAYYGTSSHNCDATRWLSHRANGKRSYSIEVTNEACGDPAHGQRKELNVTYRCGEIEKTASANEHRTIYLNCAS